MKRPITSNGLLLVLSAPSGAGKTTLARELARQVPGARVSMSTTTREPRGQERNGVDYHFVDTLTFQQKIEEGEFLEWAEVHGHFYGTPQQIVDTVRAENGIGVFDIDVQGGQAISRKHPDAVLVFVLPPSMEELERRLRERKTDSEEMIRRRMLAARAEMQTGVATYDYIVINDDFSRALNEIRSVVLAERCRRGRVDLQSIGLSPASETDA
ncbi:MAG: guanylate kinase [Myxococcaceae bacterium]